ncbi:hypothetical protein DL89DRAFT_264046 [Linderina pennispora]|uniref:Uncharacterized protein n=1 Tax=Linderina pennispora TaxID=61395 RepID=A0A1Y1WL21_9FUNG|nr:uncharacterized protein DL89DRAFT_264046 [Linderina pennispora]ORX74065.1 hypothetical protein DL89DRAFT_264046 [Linderina pennispora]
MLFSNSSNDSLTTVWQGRDSKRAFSVLSDKHMSESLQMMLETVTSLILMRHVLCQSILGINSSLDAEASDSDLYDSEMVMAIDKTISSLRECIEQHMNRLPLSDTKLSIIFEFERYFESAAGAKIAEFNEFEFYHDPREYLDSFVPSYVVDASTASLNWRSFIMQYPLPLVNYYVEHDLADVTSWDTATSMLDAAFKSSLPEARLSRHRLALRDVEEYNAILGLHSQYAIIALLTKHQIGHVGKFNFHDLE